ncbi:MAG: hypothetical protein KQH53_11740 [Desulfarculaceae bacterium]|nr:hypothetical protein [Desulfarculaceae bacterium]
MHIIAHRGLWTEPAEKNTLAAFKSALAQGYGVEFDIRDLAGDLLVSHDLPDASCPRLEPYLEAYAAMGAGSFLAVNIKSCGLHNLLKDALARHGVDHYFVFDLAIPDALPYLDAGMCFYTRQSEIEREAVLYGHAQGVWLDQFYGEWVTPGMINEHLDHGKSVCLVSPELHRREHLPFWETLREIAGSGQVMLCTDYPEQAEEFFND